MHAHTHTLHSWSVEVNSTLTSIQEAIPAREAHSRGIMHTKNFDPIEGPLKSLGGHPPPPPPPLRLDAIKLIWHCHPNIPAPFFNASDNAMDMEIIILTVMFDLRFLHGL